MNLSPRTTTRVLGALALAGAFVTGVFAARWMTPPAPGVTRVSMTVTDAMPLELTRLGLSKDQETALRPLLREGADRMMRVLDEFDPRFRAAVDSTDAAVRRVLTASQRAAFDSARRVNGSPLRRSRILRPDSAPR